MIFCGFLIMAIVMGMKWHNFCLGLFLLRNVLLFYHSFLCPFSLVCNLDTPILQSLVSALLIILSPHFPPLISRSSVTYMGTPELIILIFFFAVTRFCHLTVLWGDSTSHP